MRLNFFCNSNLKPEIDFEVIWYIGLLWWNNFCKLFLNGLEFQKIQCYYFFNIYNLRFS